MKLAPPYSLVAELHEGGVCSRSFHDPGGQVVPSVSEVLEHGGSLYLGSYRSPFLIRLDLRVAG